MSGAGVVSVGGLLPRDLLDRVTAGDSSLPGIDPTDYGLVPGERLTDAITRSWNRLQGVWEAFRRAEANLPDADATATGLTRDRWLRPLLDELGFAGLPVARGLSLDGKDYPISHQWGGTVPVHLPGVRVPVDRVSRGVPGAARTSPHGLVQEFLNRSESHLWGIVSNGGVLRILRNNASLTRQAYVEFDLEAMFDSEAYSDFVLLWLCCHRSRFEGEPAEKCLLEQWTAEAATAGTRALDRLREGVEAAINSLGQGFVAHPANTDLREALRSGELSAEELQRQLLRLVYRLLFLLVAESRDLLLDPKADQTARQRYHSFYSMERLRTLAARRRGSPHDDLWASLEVTMSALGSKGAPAMGIAPLGSFLWSPQAIAALAGSRIDNRHLLAAVRHLCWVRDEEAKVDRLVDYRSLGAEELGSVYESLLELHAWVDVDARSFETETVAGSERKTTGSYYTPTSLIQVLLDSALDPVLNEAERAGDPESALLGLKVLDPATGSGHFLIAAAHRIAGRLASIRAAGGEPAPDDLRRALRDVIARCIYGIDVNPMAVELCKVSLWMEAQEPGRPLSFVDHRIVCGNSLLGATPALMEAGVPDAAFKPIEGDDKNWASTLKKTNKRERTHRNQGMLDFGSLVAKDAATLADGVADIDALGEDSIEAVSAKEARFAELQASDAAARAKLAADAWCAAFVAPKTKDAPILTDAVVRTCGSSPEKVPADVRGVIEDMAQQYRFLHPHVAFPDIFTVPDNPDHADNELWGWSGGFDVVLGNPPWEQLLFQDKEFFAVHAPPIAQVARASERAKLIEQLADDEPWLHFKYTTTLRTSRAEQRLLRNSGRFPLAGVGRHLVSAGLFAELAIGFTGRNGRAGLVLPTEVATGDTLKHLFSHIVDHNRLVSLYDFENKERIFPGIDSRIRFCLITIGGLHNSVAAAELAFGLHNTSELINSSHRYLLSPEDLSRLNPNTKNCPTFRSEKEAQLVLSMYKAAGAVLKHHGSDTAGWNIATRPGLFNMALQSSLFSTREELSKQQGFDTLSEDFLALRLYEAKMVHQFNHRWSSFDESTTLELTEPLSLAQPRYWIPLPQLDARTTQEAWFLVFRDITNATNERTSICSAIPPTGVAHHLTLVSASKRELLMPVLNSFAVDFVARRKIGGTHLTVAAFEQLPLHSVATYSSSPPWLDASIEEWLRRQTLELVYTAWDLTGFATDLRYHGPPFRWDEERRSLLRAELDALMFRLYGVEGHDVDYILDTFPIVKRKDEAAFGEYRTKRLILERFDAMAKAEATGRPYETILDPPPADPSLAHPESTRPPWAAPSQTVRDDD